MNGLTVGAKVTVKTTDADPVHLVTNPHVVIAEVADSETGPVFFVRHNDVPAAFRPRTFGPFPAAALELGW